MKVEDEDYRCCHLMDNGVALPVIVMLYSAHDGLWLYTWNLYLSPNLAVTIRELVYCAVTASVNTVIPPVTLLESLVQVTMEGGPPLVTHVRMCAEFSSPLLS